jgi:predicted metalloprotease with PDZ domain
MRRAYEKFYLNSPSSGYYLQGRGYTIEEFQRLASEVALMDLDDFFFYRIARTEPLPYDEVLAAVGLRLNKSVASQPYNGGIVIDREDRFALRLGNLRSGSPAELGGLQQGDILTSIGGTPVSEENWKSVLNRFKRGDRIPVIVRRFRRPVTVTLELGEPELFVYRIEVDPNAPPQAIGLRQAWLVAGSYCAGSLASSR